MSHYRDSPGEQLALLLLKGIITISSVGWVAWMIVRDL